MARPRIKSPCVADRRSSSNERTAEFSSRYGGGLINIWEKTNGEERTTLSVYRTDPTVDVLIGTADSGTQPPIYVSGIRAPDLRKLRELLEGLAIQNAGSAHPITTGQRAGSVVRPVGAEEGSHILIRREDWQALVELRAFMDGEG